MKALAPVMFISHGSPMFAANPGGMGLQLKAHSALFDNVNAILIISPHWSTRGSVISSAEHPTTLHDFGGFPKNLYQLTYPAPGAPELAKATINHLNKYGFKVSEDKQRGLDHGAWTPLLHLRPDADIPIYQLSLNVEHSYSQLVALGKALVPLREQGIAIIASGGVTHNLYDVRFNRTDSAEYVKRFEQWLKHEVSSRHINTLLNPTKTNQDFNRAHPTDEHYKPLLVTMGATSDQDHLKILEAQITDYAISMTSFLWSKNEV